MKFWQLLALISGSIIAVVMALASISYNSTLGTAEAAFTLIPISNRSLFEALALAFDLGMVASVFGFWHWLKSNRVAAIICGILFVIASLFSVHSVRGYIAQNVTKSLAPMERNKDVYASLKLELVQAQKHQASLQASLLKARGRKRTRLLREVEQQSRMIREIRNRLATTKTISHVTPVAGLEWFLAVILWFFNATCWTAWFGTSSIANSRTRAQKNEHSARHPEQSFDSVQPWLVIYEQKQPEHCAQLYEHYSGWCMGNDIVPLVDRKFYARLIELGARKFRDGRSGPMLYALPHDLTSTDRQGR
jgi:lysylphosphatidylglycerol synthetase-like protein (DUF2156 family)